MNLSLVFLFKREVMLLCSNEGFFELHSSATEQEKDEIRVQNDSFAGNNEILS